MSKEKGKHFFAQCTVNYASTNMIMNTTAGKNCVEQNKKNFTKHENIKWQHVELGMNTDWHQVQVQKTLIIAMSLENGKNLVILI